MKQMLNNTHLLNTFKITYKNNKIFPHFTYRRRYYNLKFFIFIIRKSNDIVKDANKIKILQCVGIISAYSDTGKEKIQQIFTSFRWYNFIIFSKNLIRQYLAKRWKQNINFITIVRVNESARMRTEYRYFEYKINAKFWCGILTILSRTLHFRV